MAKKERQVNERQKNNVLGGKKREKEKRTGSDSLRNIL